MPDLLGQLEPLVQHYGLIGLFVDVFLESMGLPFPGEALIIAAAGLASLGQLNIYAVAATAFSAAVLGDNVGYLVGRKLGRPVVIRYGAKFGITNERLSRIERLIDRRGPLIVIAARFVVVLRQLNGIGAGTAGMHWLRFLVANTIGAAIWVGFWTTLVFFLGQKLIPPLLHHLSWVALALVVLVVAMLAGGWFAVWRMRKRSALPTRRTGSGSKLQRSAVDRGDDNPKGD